MCYPSVPGVGHSVYSNEKRRGRGQTSLDTNSQVQDSGSSRDAASVCRPRNFSLAVSVGDRFPWQVFVRIVCTGYNTSGLALIVCEFRGNETWETYRSAIVFRSSATLVPNDVLWSHSQTKKHETYIIAIQRAGESQCEK